MRSEYSIVDAQKGAPSAARFLLKLGLPRGAPSAAQRSDGSWEGLRSSATIPAALVRQPPPGSVGRHQARMAVTFLGCCTFLPLRPLFRAGRTVSPAKLGLARLPPCGHLHQSLLRRFRSSLVSSSAHSLRRLAHAAITHSYFSVAPLLRPAGSLQQ